MMAERERFAEIAFRVCLNTDVHQPRMKSSNSHILLLTAIALAIPIMVNLGSDKPSPPTAEPIPELLPDSNSPIIEAPGFVDRASVSMQRKSVEGRDVDRDESLTTIDETPVGGKIGGFVYDDNQIGFGGAEVQLYAKAKLMQSETSRENGRFAFTDLKSGKYSVRINGDKLPEEFLGPWRQSVGTPGQGNQYQAKRVSIPSEGGSFEVELRVFAKSVAWGTVLGRDGKPVENATVRLQGSAARGQPASLHADAFTDKDGRFEIQNVYPGTYVLTASPFFATEKLYQTQLAPIPLAVTILAGGVYDLGIIQLGVGTNTIVGRVVDEQGVPFKNLRVIAYPAGSPGEGFREYGLSALFGEAHTDADGYYRLERIPDAAVNIHVGADYMEKPLGTAQAAFWIPPISVILSGSKEHFVPDAILPRSRPFRIYGYVTIDEEWGAKTKNTFADFFIHATLLDPQAPPVPNRPSFHINRVHEIDSTTGEFEIMLETPHHPIKVTIGCRRRGTSSFETVIYDLVPNGEIELTPVFPMTTD